MNDPKNKPENSGEECDEQSIDCAEKKLHTSVAQEHPEWVEENGDCPSCVSLEHEMADPQHIPEETQQDNK